MKKGIIFLIFVLFVGISSSIQAQNYKTAIGLRLGPSYGFTIKHFFKDRLAFEGLLTSRYYGPFKGKGARHAYGFGNGAAGINLTALIEYHFPIGNIAGFNWFIGGGIHLGVWEGESGHPWFPSSKHNGAHFLTGIDAIGGVEYTFSKIPLTLQVDYKPSFNFFEYLGVWTDELAITARFTF